MKKFFKKKRKWLNNFLIFWSYCIEKLTNFFYPLFWSYCIEKLTNFFYPHKCFSCKKIIEKEGFCSECFNNKVKFILKPYCSVCGNKLFIKNIEENSNLKCPDCFKEPKNFDKALSVFVYNDTIAGSIHSFKANNKFMLARFFSKFLLEKINVFPDNIDYIAPVPMHIKKIRIRGYNQTILLVKEMEKKGYNNIIYDLLKKEISTIPQKLLNYKERKKNLKDSFALNLEYLNLIQGKNILIVDDVFTTGTTVNECSKVLKKYGVKKVFVLTIAKTVFNYK